MITRISLRSLSGIALFVLSLFVVASCSEVPVDDSTAHIVTRRDDTVKLPPDTISLPPDTVTLPPDTITLVRDTVIIRRDTVVQTVIHDSLRTDTLRVYDTVFLQERSHILNGTLRCTTSDSTVVCTADIDTVGTVLTVHMKNNKPDAISLRLSASFPQRTKQIGWTRINLVPQWCQVQVDHCRIQGYGVWLTCDPLAQSTTSQSGIGLLYRTVVGNSSARWLTPANQYGSYNSWATFKVLKVDTNARLIDANITGSFATGETYYGYPGYIAVDSLKLQMGY